MSKSILIDRRPKVAICGLWHLGETYLAGLSHLQNRVVGLCETETECANWRAGRLALAEPGLQEFLDAGLAGGQIEFFSDWRAAAECEVVCLTIDTPVDERDRADVRPLELAIERLAPHLRDGVLLLVASQVPVGTGTAFRSLLARMRPQLRFDYAYCPENLRLGEALRGFLEPDRIVLGVENEAVETRCRTLFSGVNTQYLVMSVPTAEMSKHAMNAFLATSISFANEIGAMCEVVGADVLAVMSALRADPRVGPRAFVQAGLGYSGGTLGRDIQALLSLSRRLNVPASIMASVSEVNDDQPRRLVEKLMAQVPNPTECGVAILGLTYKPGTPTMRRSRAIELAQSLRPRIGRLCLHDPAADPNDLPADLREFHVADALSACIGASAVALSTPWPEYARLDWSAISAAMAPPRLVFDCSNFLAADSARLGSFGIRYLGVGR